MGDNINTVIIYSAVGVVMIIGLVLVIRARRGKKRREREIVLSILGGK